MKNIVSTWCQIWCLWQHRDRNSYCLILQSKQLRHHRPKYLGSHWQWTGIQIHKVCWLSMRGFLSVIHSEVKHVWKKLNYLFNAYLFLWSTYQIDAFTHGALTEQFDDLKSSHLGAKIGGARLHPMGWFFGPSSFIISKSSHQDLFNEGSNFILSQLETGFWVAETWPFLTNFNVKRPDWNPKSVS